MNWFARYLLLFFCGCLVYTKGSFAESTSQNTLSVSLVVATSVDKNLPFGVLVGQTWEPEKDAEFVKVHIHSDTLFKLGKIEVESCSNPFTSLIELYVNADELVDFLFNHEYGAPPSKTASYMFEEKPMMARSVTLNFQGNKPLCISAIRFFDEKGNPYAVKVPRVVEGKTVASSTLEPHLSYDVMNLFDSRYEYGWASNHKSSGDMLDFEFAKEEHIDKIKIWNGYQRSAVHFSSNSRIKKLKLEGDNNYSAVLPVADLMGPQLLDLKKPFNGRHLKMSILESYPGKTYKDLVVSELRFYDGKDWFVLNPLPAIQAMATNLRNEFNRAKLDRVLNKGLRNERKRIEKIGDREIPILTEYWRLRLRADGSFYIEGTQFGEDRTGKTTNALGNYEVIENANSGMKLRLFGFLTKKKNQMSGDCDEAQDIKIGKDVAKIFQEFITLFREGDKIVMVNNGQPRNLDFDKLVLGKDQ